VTPRLQDLAGSYLQAGIPIAEVADMSTLRARIYIPEFGMRQVSLGTRVRLEPNSRFLPVDATLLSLGPTPAEAAPGLLSKEQLKGLNPPRFYVGSALVPNTSGLREGMSGTAKIFVAHRSLGELAGIFARDLIGRKIW
jgi:hypothetical protein